MPVHRESSIVHEVRGGSGSRLWVPPTPEPTYPIPVPTAEFTGEIDMEQELDLAAKDLGAKWSHNGYAHSLPQRGVVLSGDSCNQASIDNIIQATPQEYPWIWIEQCWLAPLDLARAAQSQEGLLAHPVYFADGIEYAAQVTHAAGRLLGVYVSASPHACGDANLQGSMHHYVEHAQQLADAGVDGVRIDRCASPDDTVAIADQEDDVGSKSGGQHVDPNDAALGYVPDALRAEDVRRFIAAFNMTGRDMWYNARCVDWRDYMDVRMPAPFWCQTATHAVFGVPNLPRHGEPWSSTILVSQALRKRTHFGPIDPSLDAGYVYAAGEDLEAEHENEDVAECALALLVVTGSPLILASDPRQLTSRFRAALTNSELLRIHDDPARLAGDYVGNVNCTHEKLVGEWRIKDECQLWVKPLADGGVAALLLNGDPTRRHTMTVDTHLLFGVDAEVDIIDIFGEHASTPVDRVEFVHVDVRPKHAALLRVSRPLKTVFRKGGYSVGTPAPPPLRED